MVRQKLQVGVEMKFGFTVPLFNTVEYLENCLMSLINQTYKKFEIIIVDNYSTDGSYEIAKKFALKYNAIKLFRKKIDGVGRLRNFAIKKIKCDYFITVDSDDYIDKKLLENLNIQINENKSIDMVRYNAVKVTEHQAIIDDSMFVTKKIGFFTGRDYLINACLEYIEHNKIFGPTWLYAINLNFYKKHRFKFSGLLQEDFGIMSSLILKSKTILCVNHNGYYYTQRWNSITNYKGNKYLKALHLLCHYDNYIREIVNNLENDIELRKVFKKYLDLSLINKYKSLPEDHKRMYINELKYRGIAFGE